MRASLLFFFFRCWFFYSPNRALSDRFARDHQRLSPCADGLKSVLNSYYMEKDMLIFLSVHLRNNVCVKRSTNKYTYKSTPFLDSYSHTHTHSTLNLFQMRNNQRFSQKKIDNRKNSLILGELKEEKNFPPFEVFIKYNTLEKFKVLHIGIIISLNANKKKVVPKKNFFFFSPFVCVILIHYNHLKCVTIYFWDVVDVVRGIKCLVFGLIRLNIT